MKKFYPENSFFGRAQFHPLFIILFGLSLSITFISAIDIFFSKLCPVLLDVSYDEYNLALKNTKIPSHFLNFFLIRLTVIQVLGFGLTGWLLIQSANHWKKELFLEFPFSISKILWAGLIMLIAIPFYQIFMLNENQLYFLSPEQIQELISIEKQTQNLLNQIMQSHLLVNTLIFAVIPAICEEIFFRGFLFLNLRRFMPLGIAILFSSLIFSLLHFQIYGFLVRWGMGCMLAYLFYYGKSIYTAIFAHFINNFFTTFATWLALNGYISKQITEHQYQFHYSIVLLSFFLTAVLSYYYYKSYKNEKLR